jgi:hypothetical protein
MCSPTIYHINSRKGNKRPQKHSFFIPAAFHKCIDASAIFYLQNAFLVSEKSTAVPYLCRCCGWLWSVADERKRDEINAKYPKIYIILSVLWKFNGPSSHMRALSLSLA